MISKILAGFIIWSIGVSLYFPIKESLVGVLNNSTSTNSSLLLSSSDIMASNFNSTVFSFVPVMFLLISIGMGLSTIISAFYDERVMDSEEYHEGYEEEPNRKQTYEEYARERLRVERMMRYGWLGRFI